MRTETTTTVIRCDRCGPNGNYENHKNHKRRLFSPTLRTSHHVPMGFFKGWFIGRKWQLCPKCSVAEKKESRAGRSKVINLNEQRSALDG